MKKIQENKKYILILVVILILIVISFSFSFFGEMIFEAADSKAGIGGNFSEKLIFENGDGINISATLENFANGSGSLRDETISTATLIPDSQIGESLKGYSVSYNITENNFEYSVNSETPELLLKIVKPSGADITSIDGLEYKKVVDALTGETLTGFDITGYVGLLDVSKMVGIFASNFESSIHEWKVSVTFVNLNTSQNVNFNKAFSGELIFEKVEYDSSVLYSEFANLIIEDNGGSVYIAGKTLPNFSTISDNNEGLYETDDNYGVAYYFRGGVDNNWVRFAGIYWRIVRINGDGTVKLIYMGTTAPTEETKVYYTSNTIGNNQYNFSSYIITEHTGYMYTLNENKGLSTDSTIKLAIDKWYEDNLLAYDSYISDNLFCNDRTLVSGQGYGNTTNTFEGYNRIYVNYNPSAVCYDSIDSFTQYDLGIGNASLTYPVGLLTADEAAMAGLTQSSSNGNNYLNGSAFWTMTPSRTYSSKFYNISINSSGRLVETAVYWTQLGIRPVINLVGNDFFTGSGTWDDPYEI